MDRQTVLLGIVTAIYGVGYVGLITIVLQGRFTGLIATVALLIATGIFIVMIVGVLFLRTTTKMLGGE